MTTYTISGFEITTDPGTAVRSLAPSTLDLVLADTAPTTFTYQPGSPSDQNTLLTIEARIGDRSANANAGLNDLFAATKFVEWRWTDSGGTARVTILLTTTSANQDVQAFFRLGGAPLPVFADIAAFDSFTTAPGFSTALPRFPFRPGDTIDIATRPGVQVSEDDLISGTEGDDEIFGPAGVRIVTGAGNDTVFGLGGNDFASLGAGDDVFDGGEGSDGVEYFLDPGTLGVVADLALGTATDPSGGTDTLISVERVFASINDDTIYGDDLNNVFVGEDGADFIDGRGGFDLIDYDFEAGPQAVTVDLAAQIGIDSYGKIDTLIAIEDVFGTALADILSGDATGNFLYGRVGNDTILGLDGDDRLFGDPGDDLLFGGLGVDTLLGGEGNDILFGDADSDDISGGFGADLIFGGDGDDTLFGFQISATEDTRVDGDDFIDGGAGNDSIQAGPGNDIVIGSEGDDSLYGGDGSNTLVGGPGDDLLQDGSGTSILIGGTGANAILSGGGADVIYFLEPDSDADILAHDRSASIAIDSEGFGIDPAINPLVQSIGLPEEVGLGSTVILEVARNQLFYDPTGGSTSDAFLFASTISLDGLFSDQIIFI